MKNDIKKWIDGLEDKALSTLRSKKFWLTLVQKVFGWLMTTKAFKKIEAKIEALEDKINKKHADINLNKRK